MVAVNDVTATLKAILSIKRIRFEINYEILQTDGPQGAESLKAPVVSVTPLD